MFRDKHQEKEIKKSPNITVNGIPNMEVLDHKMRCNFTFSPATFSLSKQTEQNFILKLNTTLEVSISYFQVTKNC